MKLWIATENQNKKKEFTELFSAYNIKIQSMADVPNLVLPPEDGQTFTENALLKAQTLFNEVHAPVLADDSGLCIDALDGAPGIYSARYAGPNKTDAEKRKFIVDKMQNIQDRKATFICVIAFIDQDGQSYLFEGKLPGTILTEDSGTNGFGYDPIFFADEVGQSLATLTQDEKNAISHRGRAIKKFLASPQFLDMLQKSEEIQ